MHEMHFVVTEKSQGNIQLTRRMMEPCFFSHKVWVATNNYNAMQPGVACEMCNDFLLQADWWCRGQTPNSLASFEPFSFIDRNNNNNNNNNNNKLQLGCYLMAVVILHVNKT